MERIFKNYEIIMDKEKLYEKLDADEELSDSERREIYESEVQADRDREDWENSF